MKKTTIVLTLLLLLITVPAYAGRENLSECAKSYGWTSDGILSPKTSFGSGEDPVAHYSIYFSILKCFEGKNGRDQQNGACWLWDEVIGLGLNAGYNVKNDCLYKDPCAEKTRACTLPCWDLSGEEEGKCKENCRNSVQFPCQVSHTISCEQKLQSAVMVWAKTLIPPSIEEEEAEPECGSNEYKVNGQCKHIFDLCGRDSLFQYNESTGECFCPDPYLPSNGKCVHVDDLYPPEPPPEETPPPSEETSPPLPPADKSSLSPPPAEEPPFDDESWNAFCQPPDAVARNVNEFGVPIANAQIYSNYSVITDLSGEVMVKTKDAPRWAPAFKGQRIMIGDRVKTGRNGNCAVKFANSTVMRMRSLSQLLIPDHKDPRYCDGKLQYGYLDLKFGKVWSRLKPEEGYYNRFCTPNTCTGRRDTQSGRSPLEGKIIRNDKMVAHNSSSIDGLVGVPFAYAAGNQTHIHISHDEETQISNIYVESGEVEIFDPEETVVVALSVNEHISVTSDQLPHDTDVEPSAQVIQWWEEESQSPLINVVVFLVGIVAIAFIINKYKKKNIFLKVAIVVTGLLLTFMFIVCIQ